MFLPYGIAKDAELRADHANDQPLFYPRHASTVVMWALNPATNQRRMSGLSDCFHLPAWLIK